MPRPDRGNLTQPNSGCTRGLNRPVSSRIQALSLVLEAGREPRRCSRHRLIAAVGPLSRLTSTSSARFYSVRPIAMTSTSAAGTPGPTDLSTCVINSRSRHQSSWAVGGGERLIGGRPSGEGLGEGGRGRPPVFPFFLARRSPAAGEQQRGHRADGSAGPPSGRSGELWSRQLGPSRTQPSVRRSRRSPCPSRRSVHDMSAIVRGFCGVKRPRFDAPPVRVPDDEHEAEEDR